MNNLIGYKSNVVVSVAILTKNPGSIFRKVLPMVLKQESPWPYEILIIDSGSTDGTLGFIKQYPNIRLIEIEPSEFGHGRTRNLAMSLAHGKYVAMLTHDAMPENNHWLTNLVGPLEADINVAGVFGRHKAYASATPYTKRDIELHFNNFLQWPSAMGIDDPERYKIDQSYRQVLHFFSDNNACLRKSVWTEIPYPDVDFAEDHLWAKTIVEAGYKRAYADDAVVFHSHDYSVLDTFRRSFDESRALKKLLRYDLCPSIWHGFYQVFACSRRDISYLIKIVGFRKEYKLALITPALHLAKQAGFYMGRFQGIFNTFLYRIFSLDGALKRKS